MNKVKFSKGTWRVRARERVRERIWICQRWGEKNEWRHVFRYETRLFQHPRHLLIEGCVFIALFFRRTNIFFKKWRWPAPKDVLPYVHFPHTLSFFGTSRHVHFFPWRTGMSSSGTMRAKDHLEGFFRIAHFRGKLKSYFMINYELWCTDATYFPTNLQIILLVLMAFLEKVVIMIRKRIEWHSTENGHTCEVPSRTLILNEASL